MLKIRYIVCSARNFRQFLHGKKFSVAGAGLRVTRILDHIRPYRPDCIIDSDPNKWGKKIAEYQIFPPSHLRGRASDTVVIATLNYFAVAADLSVEGKELVYVLPPVELIYGYS